MAEDRGRQIQGRGGVRIREEEEQDQEECWVRHRRGQGGKASAATGKDATAASQSTWEQVQAVKGALWEMFTTDKDTKEWWATVRRTPFSTAARNPLELRPLEERPIGAPAKPKPADKPSGSSGGGPEWATVKQDDDIQKIALCLARRLQYGVAEDTPTYRLQAQVILAWLDGFARNVGGIAKALTQLGVPDYLNSRNEADHESIAAAIFTGSPDAIRSVNRHTAIWDWYVWEDPEILERMIYEPEAFGPAEDQANAQSEYPDWRGLVQDV